MVLLYIYMGVSVYCPLSVLCVIVCVLISLCVYLCVCVCVCVCACVCMISNRSRIKKPHYVSDLSKLDALLHKTHKTILLYRVTKF